MKPPNKASARVCPICLTLKEIPNRSIACSTECGHKWRVTSKEDRVKHLAEAARLVPAATALDTSADNQFLPLLKDGPVSVVDIANRADVSPRKVVEALDRLRAAGHLVEVRADDKIVLSSDVKPGGEEPLIVHNLESYSSGFRTFGLTSDNHLGSKHERLDVLTALYNLYAEEGVTEVLNAGNWIEGEARFNKHDIKVYGMDRQIDYMIENYPQRPGITTYFVAGDDHEGWYQQREQVEIGRYLELRARRAGRTDLVYKGYVEADIELKAAEGSCWMKLMHPGGGSAYALSYSAQKLVECVPLSSEILTRDGWKTHEQVQVGETVLGYDVESGRCEWTALLAKNYGTGEIVRYRNDQFHVECTRDHRWAIEEESRGCYTPRTNPSYRKSLQYGLWSIDQCKNRSRIIQAAPGPEGPGAEWVEHLDWIDRNNAVAWVLRMTSAQRQAFIYGMMLGEGTVCRGTGASNALVFSQNPGPVHDAFVIARLLEGGASGVARLISKKMNGDEKIGCRTTLLRKNKRSVSSMEEQSSRNGDVWCPSTGLGTWVMRQNDVVTITGNSFQGGEKPSVLIYGHYHKFDYNFAREVHCIGTGCTVDQSVFMRKNKIQAHVGGLLLRINQAPTGEINRCQVEWLPFYDRDFYRGRREYIGRA